MRERVIDPAVKEINEFAEFGLEVDYVRGGRGGKVVGVKFSAVPKNAASISDAANLAAATTSIRKRGPRDHETIDMFSGAADAELNEPLVLRSDTMEEAKRMLGAEGNAEDEFATWQREFKGKQRMLNPDEMFLSWLGLRVKKRDDDRFTGVDIEALFVSMVPND